MLEEWTKKAFTPEALEEMKEGHKILADSMRLGDWKLRQLERIKQALRPSAWGSFMRCRFKFVSGGNCKCLGKCKKYTVNAKVNP